MRLPVTSSLRFSVPSSLVILSEARSAEPKNPLSFMPPRSSEGKQVLRLRCAPLRMTKVVGRNTNAQNAGAGEAWAS
jgi:hypothetical protein